MHGTVRTAYFEAKMQIISAEVNLPSFAVHSDLMHRTRKPFSGFPVGFQWAGVCTIPHRLT